MNFALIVAVDKNNGIGKNNKLPWRLPTDLKFFSEVTSRTHSSETINAVIMGRNTWESLPKKHRPLPGRLNVVLSRSNDLQLPPDVIHAFSFDDALEKVKSLKKIDHVFVIGGAKVFMDVMNHPSCHTIYLTQIEQTFDCDTFFPKIDENTYQIKEKSGKQTENGIDFQFLTYERKP
jgi:dihydrofolate reductase/thymidylate synthase